MSSQASTHAIALHIYHKHTLGSARKGLSIYVSVRGQSIVLFTWLNFFFRCDINVKRAKMNGWLIFRLAILVHTLTVVLTSTYNGNYRGYSSIPTSIPTETTRLYLEGNLITSVSQNSLMALANITLLDISRNLLRNVETDSFFGLKIQNLILSYNQLTTVPHIEPLAYSLLLLDLQNNRITTIEPFTFSNFTSLEQLYLSINHIKGLPEFALHTPHCVLSEIHINRNGLSTISRLAFAGMNLYDMKLTHNALNEFPCFENARKIRNLYLRGNPITTIPNGCGQWWGALHSLYLEQTHLMSLDSIISYSHNLRTLHVDGSHIALSDETFKDTPHLSDIIMRDANQFPRFHSTKSNLVLVELGGITINCVEEAWLDGMNNVVTFALRHTSITLFPHPGCSNNTYENHTVHGYFQSLHTMLIYNSTLMHFPT